MKKREVPDVSSEQMEYLIEQWIHNKRDWEVCRRRLIDGVRFEPLAEEFELSVRGTKYIVYRCLDKIMSKIE